MYFPLLHTVTCRRTHTHTHTHCTLLLSESMQVLYLAATPNTPPTTTTPGWNRRRPHGNKHSLSLSLSLSPSLSFSHTHTQTNMSVHGNTHTHTVTHSLVATDQKITVAQVIPIVKTQTTDRQTDSEAASSTDALTIQIRVWLKCAPSPLRKKEWWASFSHGLRATHKQN